MTRNLPEPLPRCTRANEWRRAIQARMDEVLDDADLHKKSGELHLIAQLYEGGVRDATVEFRSTTKVKPTPNGGSV